MGLLKSIYKALSSSRKEDKYYYHLEKTREQIKQFEKRLDYQMQKIKELEKRIDLLEELLKIVMKR